MDNDDREIKSPSAQESPKSDKYEETAWYKASCRKWTWKLWYISEINSQLTSLPAASQMFTKKKKWCVTSKGHRNKFLQANKH